MPPYYFWPLVLFGLSFLIGIVAVLAGVGGGVIFVPIVSGFFPFHLDFVRSAGLMVALASSISAGPFLLKKGIASLRLAMPLALVASVGAIAGAILGLLLPVNIIQISLGFVIMVIALVIFKAKSLEYPEVTKPDRLSRFLGLSGIYHESSENRNVCWQAHRTPQALVVFVVIGFAAGMFGLGSGWANVPVLNLMMGAPLKVAVSTSSFLISISAPSAAWVYMNNGTFLSIIVAPSVIGTMLGARVGAALLPRVRPAVVRHILISLLLFSGIRSLTKGFGF